MEVEDEERSETLSQVSSNASTEPLSPEALERQRSQQLSTSARPRETSAEGESRTRGGSLTSDLSNLSDMDMDDFEPETSRPEDNQPTFQEELHILEQDELQRNTAATPPSVESAQGTIGHGPPAELAHPGTDLYHPAEAEGYGQQNKTAESEAPEVSTEAEGDQPEDNVLQRIQAEESAQMHQEQDYDEEEDEEEVMQPTELEQPQGPEAYDPEEPEEAEPDSSSHYIPNVPGGFD